MIPVRTLAGVLTKLTGRPRALMPPMGGLLDDEQVAAVVTYI